MTLPVLPVIGSTGSYDLLTPFDTQAINGEAYTCMAVRRISDYLANNEDPKTTVYLANGIDEAVWLEDVQANAYIVSLQSLTGHWLYVPARYIERYPSVNGVAYRTVMIGIALPSLPVAQDLTPVTTDLKAYTEAALGLTVNVKVVETSKPVLVTSEIHESKQLERAMAQAGQSSLYAQLQAAQQREQNYLTKIQALEQYILDHHTP